MHREHHHRGAGPLFLDLLRRLEAVHVRHPDVHEDHVGELAAGVFDGLAARAGLADDLEVVGLGQHRRDPLPHELVVVHEEHSNCHARAF